MDYSIGRTGLSLTATTNAQEQHVRAGLYIRGEQAESRLQALERQRGDIERELGYELAWGDQGPSAKDRRISLYPKDANPDDESDWQRQHEWLATRLNELYSVFADRIRSL